MKSVKQWIGIDGCKPWLDVPLRPQNQSLRLSNHDSGIRELLTYVAQPEALGRVTLESTGADERQVALVS